MKEALQSLHGNKVIEDLMWPKFEFENCIEDIKLAKRLHTSRLAEIGIALALEPRPQDLPDFSGQFLALLQEDVFDAIFEADTDCLGDVLPGYVAAVLFSVRSGYDSDLPLTDPRVPGIALQAFAELMDLVEIFGLAKIVSEFHENHALWQVFDSQWKAMTALPGTNLLSKIASLNGLANRAMQMESHSDLRFRWRRNVEILLEDAPVDRRMHSSRDHSFLDEEIVPTHVSPLIRALTRTRGGGLNRVNGIAVMMVEVIRKDLPVVAERLPYNERSLMDRLERVSE